MIKPCEDISKHTHLKVKFEKLKSGRKVSSVRFKITGKLVARLTKKTGVEIEQTKTDARRADSELYASAMSNPYTKMLVGTILSPDDLLNQKTMLFIARHVYPLYDQLVKRSGGGIVGQHALEDHLRYIRRRYIPNEDQRKQNIGRYLEVAVNEYLKRIN